MAEATFQPGYGVVVMAPAFGTERRGAPVSTSLKISRDKIYDLSPIRFPDIVVVLEKGTNLFSAPQPHIIKRHHKKGTDLFFSLTRK